MYEMFLGSNYGFTKYGYEHLIPIFLISLFTWQWIRKSRYQTEEKNYHQAFVFSLVLAGSVLVWMLIQIATQRFNPAEDLPFHLCNILALVFPVALKLRKPWIFGILYFWVLVGTFQAVITPDLKEKFPHYIYFRYWLIHCGLIALTLYGIIILKWQVYSKDIRNAIVATNVYLVFSFIVNYLSGGNYFYSFHKPVNASLLDYMGEWPLYLFTGQALMLVLFIVYYLPILYFRRNK